MKVEHPNFIADGKVYLVRCPKCEKENWAPAVAHGICTWCGFNANEKDLNDYITKNGGKYEL